MKSKKTLDRLGNLHLVRLTVSALLIAIGLLMWGKVANVQSIMFSAHGENFSNTSGIADIGSRPDLCKPLSNPNGYLFISGSIKLENIANQAFLQTADAETGLFFEMSPTEYNQIRLGIHLKDDTTKRIKFKSQYRYTPFNYAILIAGDGSIRMVGDGRDVRDEAGPIAISCNNVRIGAGNQQETFTGSITAYVSAGTNIDEINKQLDDYLALTERNIPSTRYQWPLYSGILLLLFGIPFRKRSDSN